MTTESGSKESVRPTIVTYLRHVVRDETDDKEATDVSSSVLEVTGAANMEFSKSTSDDAVDDDNLLVCQSKESIADVRYGQQLTLDQQQELQSVISEYKHIFTDLPGTTDLIKHHVNVTCSDPVQSKPYPIPYRLREMLKNDIRDMLRMGVIRRSTSPYASPVVIVRKKDGLNRVCVDYRKLNKITIFDPEPMGSTDEIFHKLSKDKYFSKIDLSKGYWQVPVAEADIAKTAFITPDGSYEFLKMPFGMMNSGATLVRGMKKLLYGLHSVDSIVDGILVHTTTLSEHVCLLKNLFQRLQRANLTARPSKCVIGSNTIDFVGNHIGQSVIGLHEENVTKIRDAPRPRTKKEIRSFLGLTGFY